MGAGDADAIRALAGGQRRFDLCQPCLPADADGLGMKFALVRHIRVRVVEFIALKAADSCGIFQCKTGSTGAD